MNATSNPKCMGLIANVGLPRLNLLRARLLRARLSLRQCETRKK
jgi:hypothetical protein